MKLLARFREKPATSRRRSPLRLLLGTLVVVLVSFALLLNYAYRTPSEAPKLSLDRVYQLAAEGRIRFAKLLDEDAVVIGQRCLGAPGGPVAGAPVATAPGGSEPRRCRPPLQPFQTSYPRSDVSTQQLIERMANGGAQVEIDKQTDAAIVKLLLTFLFPLLVLANLFGIIFVARSGGDSTMADIAGFGRIDKKGKKKEKEAVPGSTVTFADIGGAEEAVAELREVTDYLKDPSRFEAYGAAAPKGVLLCGPPGCGKTLMARAVAGEAGVPFFAVSGAEFVESLVGVGAARVRDLFRQVKEQAPAIVFIDEIDAVGRKRGGEGSTGGEREQTVNQLLVELDGFEVNQGIVLMGATNRPDILDPALLRPGRFDRHVTLEPPDVTGRLTILNLHARDKPLAEGVDFEHLARRTSGLTGADLANVLNEAALLTIRGGPGTLIGTEQLLEAVQRVLHGPQRRGKLMTPEERSRLAYHESGHALVAAALGQSGAVHRVSIVARGGRSSLGSTSMTSESDRILLTARDMHARLTITMAGAAAERLMFADSSTTSEDDLAKANAMAREMVGIHGMSAEVGPLRLLSSEGGYLGRDLKVVEAVSGNTLAAFDVAVRALIEQAQDEAGSILASHRVHLDRIAEALAEHESLEGPALERLLAAARPEGAASPTRSTRSAAAAQDAPGDSPRRPLAGRAARQT